MFENPRTFREIFQKLDMQIRVSGWCVYAAVGHDWFFLPFYSSVLPAFFQMNQAEILLTANSFQMWAVIMYKSSWCWIVWIRTRTFFRDMNIKEEHPNSKEKRERRKDDTKGRKKDKPNNLVQVQLFKNTYTHIKFSSS